MSVSVVTNRKGGTRATVVPATAKLKAAWIKNGAQDVVLSQVMAGPDTNNWTVRIAFANWESFGKAMQNASNDPAIGEAIAELDGVSELVSRRLMGTVDL